MAKDQQWIMIGLLAGVGYWLYSNPSVLDTSGYGVVNRPQPYPAGTSIVPATGSPGLSPDQQIQQIISGTHQMETGAGGALAATAGLASSIAATSATGSFLLIGATAWTVIGAAIAGITALVIALRTDVHLYADQLVQYENPFGAYVIQVIQHETQSWNAGTLTCADAQAFHTALQDAWAHYQNTMHQFMTRGTDWLIVAKQSLNNLDNQYRGETLPNGKVLAMGMGGQYPNGFMSTWLNWQLTVSGSVCA